MSAPTVACELMMGWWGVGFGGGARRPTERVMQSSPFVRCMVKVGRAPAVCGVPAGSCQGMCVGAHWMEAGRGGDTGTGRRGVAGEEGRVEMRRAERTRMDSKIEGRNCEESGWT